MAERKEKLFSDFSPVSTEQWIEKATADLKGADFEKKLVWRTNEGFSVKPFYRKEDLEGLKTTDALPGEFPYLRGTRKNNVWMVRQDIAVDDAKEANRKALDILMKGVDSILNGMMTLRRTSRRQASILHTERVRSGGASRMRWRTSFRVRCFQESSRKAPPSIFQ